jgi:hypothetical protein
VLPDDAQRAVRVMLKLRQILLADATKSQGSARRYGHHAVDHDRPARNRDVVLAHKVMASLRNHCVDIVAARSITNRHSLLSTGGAGPVYAASVMDDSYDDRLTRIERLLEELRTQNSELHRLALLASERQAAPPRPAKQRVRKKR